jgi:hypothetical protein
MEEVFRNTGRWPGKAFIVEPFVSLAAPPPRASISV